MFRLISPDVIDAELAVQNAMLRLDGKKTKYSILFYLTKRPFLLRGAFYAFTERMDTRSSPVSSFTRESNSRAAFSASVYA